MQRRTAATGLLIGAAFLTCFGVAALLWPLLTCPHCHGAGQDMILNSPTDTMGGIPPIRTVAKCLLCIGRKRVTLAQAIRYRITGRPPWFEPPYERYLIDEGR